MVPVRALPSVAATLNVNRDVIANAHSILSPVWKPLASAKRARYEAAMGHSNRQLQQLATALILTGTLNACDKDAAGAKFSTKDNGVTMPEPRRALREKCYGIAKAQYNDCAAGPGTDCAGTARKDFMPSRWKYVLAGECEALGGSLKPGRRRI